MIELNVMNKLESSLELQNASGRGLEPWEDKEPLILMPLGRRGPGVIEVFPMSRASTFQNSSLIRAWKSLKLLSQCYMVFKQKSCIHIQICINQGSFIFFFKIGNLGHFPGRKNEYQQHLLIVSFLKNARGRLNSS